MSLPSLRGALVRRAYVLRRLLRDRAVQRRAPNGRRVFDPAAPPEQGVLDTVEGGVAAGWARDLSGPSRLAEVDLYLDGRFLGRTRADRPRPDLARQEGFGTGRHGFAFALSPGAVLAGRELRAYAAASGLELLGSPLRLDRPAPPPAAPPARRALRRLRLPTPAAVTLADQARAYGRRLAVLVEADPDYPDGARPISRAMGYVNARLHGGELTGVGPSGFFALFDAAAQHFASAPAGLPVGAELAAALIVPAAAGPLGGYLVEALRRRADPPPPDEVALAGLALDYLYTHRLPLELLGAPATAWLREDPARWRGALRGVTALAPAAASGEALEAAARHLGLARLLDDGGAASETSQAIGPLPGLRVVEADYGDSGLAVNTRRSLEALTVGGVAHDHVRINLRAGHDQGWAEIDTRGTVLIHAQPDDAVELILRMPAAQSDQRLIGFFMWETEAPPPWFTLGLKLVDEVWTGSRYCAEAFAPLAAGPARVVGHAVVPAPAEAGFDARARMEAPADAFLAYTHYDARSWITRKNPLAVAQAFQLAFPRGDEAARLLIKTRGGFTDPSDAARAASEELEAMLAADPRMRLLDVDLKPEELSALMEAADAYLSLHRGEGFGYAPAEALLAGVPLIVSAYGGSLDFTGDAWLVPCRRRAVRPGEFVASGQGQTWGEPDPAVAARHLRAIYDDREDARRRARAARAAAAGALSLEALAARYAEALAAGD